MYILYTYIYLYWSAFTTSRDSRNIEHSWRSSVEPSKRQMRQRVALGDPEGSKMFIPPKYGNPWSWSILISSAKHVLIYNILELSKSHTGWCCWVWNIYILRKQTFLTNSQRGRRNTETRTQSSHWGRDNLWYSASNLLVRWKNLFTNKYGESTPSAAQPFQK